MGKGDKRTRRGMIYKGSYGKTRPQRTKKKKTSCVPSFCSLWGRRWPPRGSRSAPSARMP
jgi:30S ribosomal protein S31